MIARVGGSVLVRGKGSRGWQKKKLDSSIQGKMPDRGNTSIDSSRRPNSVMTKVAFISVII